MEMIGEMDKELTEVIEDFDRAVVVEGLRLVNETSKPHFLNLSIVDPQELNVEHARAEQARAEQMRAEKMREEQARAEQAREEQMREEQEWAEQAQAD